MNKVIGKEQKMVSEMFWFRLHVAEMSQISCIIIFLAVDVSEAEPANLMTDTMWWFEIGWRCNYTVDVKG